MTNSEIILDNTDSDKIVEEIKKIIISRHPIIENRSEVLMKYGRPRYAMDIEFNIGKDDDYFTQVCFLDGTNNFKSSIKENLMIKGLVDKEVLIKLIAFILENCNYIRTIDKCSGYKNIPAMFKLDFDINFGEHNEVGLDCHYLGLKMETYEKDAANIMKPYLVEIGNTYYDNLKHTYLFQKQYQNYMELSKDEFLNSLNSEELRYFFELLDDSILRNMVLNMANDEFIDTYKKFENSKVKKLERK